MDASFQAGSNDTIGGHVRHRRPDISPPFHGGGHIGPHLRHHMRLFTLTPTGGGKGGDGNLPSSHGGGPLQPQLRHQNRLFSANVALFSMLNRPDCRQKEGGKGAAGERVNNILGLNVRLSHFVNNQQRGCTFCSLNNVGNLPDETFSHLFYDCETTKSWHLQFLREHFPANLFNNDAEEKLFLITGFNNR